LKFDIEARTLRAAAGRVKGLPRGEAPASPGGQVQSLILAVSLIARSSARMASITIRKLDEGLKARLRIRAARNGRSMEDEARDVLRIALAHEQPAPRDLVEAVRRRFGKIGPVELPIPAREPMRGPPDFDK
jgi:plasmid stability protein